MEVVGLSQKHGRRRHHGLLNQLTLCQNQMSRPLQPETPIDPSPARRTLRNNSGSRGSRLSARMVPKPLTLPLKLLFLPNYIAAKYESDFADGAELVGIVTRGTEDVT